MLRHFVISSSILAIMLGGAAAQQTMAPYTSQQAGQGRADYMTQCASCHQANLTGGGEAPSLAAGNFRNKWPCLPRPGR